MLVSKDLVMLVSKDLVIKRFAETTRLELFSDLRSTWYLTGFFAAVIGFLLMELFGPYLEAF